MAFLSVEDCIAKLLTSKPIQLKVENTPLLQAKSKVLAEDIIASVDVPPADNSAMDGYAFRYADAKQYSRLTISQRIQAGDNNKPLDNKTAARIFTGAELPKGADTVEMQENCNENYTKNNHIVEIPNIVKKGSNIRRKGQDIQKGSTILTRGQRLRAQELGLLASVGISVVKTFAPLNIAIVNTGNELVEPGKTLDTGQIYNSNRFLLDGLLNQWGFTTQHCDIVKDTLEQTKRTLLSISQNSDIVITTGGVSVGEEDHIRSAVEALGSIDLWKVAIKPGKPFAFGCIINTKNTNTAAFIGLPGNPSSVFVTLLILARQYLLKQQGLQGDLSPTINSATATFERKTTTREEYLRANYIDGKVDIYMNQSSGVLTSASWGNCFVKQQSNTDINYGDTVSIIFYSHL